MITVGDLKLTAAEVEKIVASLPPQNRQYFASPAGRPQLADFLALEKDAIAKEAVAIPAIEKVEADKSLA